jgi:hypothetical protein
MSENAERFLGIESDPVHITAPPPLPQLVRAPEPVEEPGVPSFVPLPGVEGHYYIKTASSRFVGLYSVQEMVEGLDSGRLKPDFLATRNLSGPSIGEFQSEHQGSWTPLSNLVEQVERVEQPELSPVEPQEVPAPSPVPQAPPAPALGWPATAGRRRWQCQSTETTLRASADEQAAVLCILHSGDEVDFSSIVSAKGKKWCKVFLRNGQTGYCPGDTMVRTLKHVRLHQAKADVLSEPATTSTVIRQLVRKDDFLLLSAENANSGSWAKIRLNDGREGYLDGKAKILGIDAKVQNTPQHDMMVGGLWCIGGIVVTAISYSAVANTGGSYLITWGAILFGGIQFLKGLARAGTED